MMGDNRDNSLDSRVAAENGGVGFVPVENLVGRAEFVVGSYDFLNAHAIWSWIARIPPVALFQRREAERFQLFPVSDFLAQRRECFAPICAARSMSRLTPC